MSPSSGYRGAMARALRDPRLSIDRPGQKPLLQGHLRKGGQAPTSPTPPTERADASATATDPTPGTDSPRSTQPAEGPETGAGTAEAVRGKSTKTPAEVATRPHLEGSEQSPQ